MAKILTKSPYFIQSSIANLDSCILKLYIYDGLQTSGRPIDATYELKATAVNNSVTFEVGELIGDYLDSDFDGTYETDVRWVDYTITQTISGVQGTVSSFTQHYAVRGYSYFDEGANYDSVSGLLTASNYKQKLSTETINIPFNTNKVSDYDVCNLSGGTTNVTVGNSNSSSNQIDYVSVPADCSHVDFNLDSGGTDTLYIENVSECKHTPYRLTFLNKEGVLEDVWMFKRSQLSTEVKSKEYMNNQINGSSFYSTNNHQFRKINISSKEKLSVNSGFVREEENETFKQLISSEKVWIKFDSQILPVNIKSESMEFKTRLNDKLINYSLDIEFAFNKINTVR